jgi:hypothetical protein
VGGLIVLDTINNDFDHYIVLDDVSDAMDVVQTYLDDTGLRLRPDTSIDSRLEQIKIHGMKSMGISYFLQTSMKIVSSSVITGIL